jgi:hypothetical protein
MDGTRIGDVGLIQVAAASEAGDVAGMRRRGLHPCHVRARTSGTAVASGHQRARRTAAGLGARRLAPVPKRPCK